MAHHTDTAAGAQAPAAAAAGPAIDWAERTDPPLYSALLWPHRSLPRKGRRTVLAIAAAGFSMPLVAMAGTVVFWGLLPFCLGGLGLLWAGLARSTRDGRIVEEITLWPDEMRVERREPAGRVLRWQAFPGFVRPRLRQDGPVRDYLTLQGGGREIELGIFLTAEERIALKRELDHQLAGLR